MLEIINKCSLFSLLISLNVIKWNPPYNIITNYYNRNGESLQFVKKRDAYINNSPCLFQQGEIYYGQLIYEYYRFLNVFKASPIAVSPVRSSMVL